MRNEKTLCPLPVHTRAVVVYMLLHHTQSIQAQQPPLPMIKTIRIEQVTITSRETLTIPTKGEVVGFSCAGHETNRDVCYVAFR
jgi:hypothetical protein